MSYRKVPPMMSVIILPPDPTLVSLSFCIVFTQLSLHLEEPNIAATVTHEENQATERHPSPMDVLDGTSTPDSADIPLLQLTSDPLHPSDGTGSFPKCYNIVLTVLKLHTSLRRNNPQHLSYPLSINSVLGRHRAMPHPFHLGVCRDSHRLPSQ